MSKLQGTIILRKERLGRELELNNYSSGAYNNRKNSVIL